MIAPHFYTSEVGVTNLTVCLPMTLARAWLMHRTHTFNVGHRSLGKVSPVAVSNIINNYPSLSQISPVSVANIIRLCRKYQPSLSHISTISVAMQLSPVSVRNINHQSHVFVAFIKRLYRKYPPSLSRISLSCN